jgi:titin
LRWTAPGDNGGSAITDYKVEYSSDGGTNWVVVTHPVSTAVSLTVSGLITRTDYKVRVSTKNAVGFSSPSTVLSVTTL